MSTGPRTARSNRTTSVAAVSIESSSRAPASRSPTMNARHAPSAAASPPRPKTPTGGLSPSRSTRANRAGKRAVALRRLLLLGALDERGRHDQRAAARDDEAVARELVERARDRLAAAADHVRELLLARPPADDEPVRSRRAL